MIIIPNGSWLVNAMRAIMQSKEILVLKLKWGDFLIFALIIIVVVVMFFSGIIGNNDEELIAEISHDGEILYKINLAELSEQTEILLDDGNVKIVAEQGRIRFEESDCPDLVCVNTGWIKKQGRIAACLPNRILIKIVGFNEEVDAVLH